MPILDGTQEPPQKYSVWTTPTKHTMFGPSQPVKDKERVTPYRCLAGMVQVQTLQATRRKEEKGAKEGQLSDPGKKQAGTLADIAEVHAANRCHHCIAYSFNAV